MIRNITVYCASSNHLAAEHLQAAAELGRSAAQRGWGIVYGGDQCGLMGAVAAAAHKAGGKVVGILPQRFHDAGVTCPHSDEVIVTRDMRQRKEILESRGDALVALPGGLGTLEELFEVIVGRQLGFHDKPIVILNTAQYYAPLLAMIDHGVEHRFIKSSSRNLYFVADEVKQAIEYLSSL
jgi:uncharacterized protein (TIGR00730 family)